MDMLNNRGSGDSAREQTPHMRAEVVGVYDINSMLSNVAH
jgi:hypothetical protein